MRYKNTFLALLLSIVSLAAYAERDNETKVTKTIDEKFLLPKNGIVEVTNKYGQVVILNSENDSVTLRIEIIAYGKDKSTADKIMDRVDFDFGQTGQYLTLETVLDRKSGVFKEAWNNIGDYSKTLLSKNKLVINYEIRIPRSASINLTNKFGDVYIQERDHKVEIDVSHGSLRANNFNANSKISVSYGDARIKYLKSGELYFRACDATIQALGTVEMQSSSSDISIKEADELQIESRSDKRIDIDKIGHIRGKLTFSKMKVENLNKLADLDLNYSDFYVAQVPFTFSMIRIDGKSSDIDLEFDPNTYLDLDLLGTEEDIGLPMTGMNREVIDEKKGIVQYKGTLGNKTNYKGKVNIKAQGGSVRIGIEQQPQSVKSSG